MTQPSGAGHSLTDAEARLAALHRQETGPTPEPEERYLLKYDLLALQPGEHVLDLRCGIGRDLVRMAPLVGPSGSVTGLETYDAVVEAARQRVAQEGLTNVRVLRADAGPLPFPDDAFDVVHTERVLGVDGDPEALVAEIVRVTRPGGRIVCCEIDSGDRFIDFDEMDLVEKVYVRGGGFSRHPYMGRQLFRRFRRAGLTDVEVRGYLWTQPNQARGAVIEADLRKAVSEGSVSPAEAERFDAQYRAHLEAGNLFGANATFLARGTKPRAAVRSRNTATD